MKATYNFIHYGFDKPSVRCSVPCEIVNETAKSYQIRLLASNVNGRNYGDVIWVQKKSVDVPREPVDCTNAWWNND